jgi:hypothetical protein
MQIIRGKGKTARAVLDLKALQNMTEFVAIFNCFSDIIDRERQRYMEHFYADLKSQPGGLLEHGNL